MIHPASFIPRLTLLAGCLLVSACALEFSGWLPPVGWLPGWALLGALLVLPARLRPLGMGVMVSAALALSIHQALQTRLDPSLEDVPLVVEGTVSSLPLRCRPAGRWMRQHPCLAVRGWGRCHYRGARRSPGRRMMRMGRPRMTCGPNRASAGGCW